MLFSVGLALKPAAEQPLRTEMTAYRGQHLQFAALRFSPHFTSSGRGLPRAAPRLLVTLQKEGVATVSQDGRENRIEAGEMFLLDPSRPFHVETGEILTHSIYLPMATVRELTPHLDRLTARPIKGYGGAGALFRALLDELFTMAPVLDDNLAAQVADTIPYVLAMALGSLDGASELSPSRLKLMHRERIRRFVRENLWDPALDVEKVAASVNLSSRYIYQLFADEPQTLMRWVWSERLERCRRELESPALQGQTIGEIAYAWGFNAVAHFSRAFRDRYGVSPREYRRQAMATASLAIAG
jgi:AraC family transcriptional regulator, positive regulator of tynA and feaB